jgi:hypothetical protein
MDPRIRAFAMAVAALLALAPATSGARPFEDVHTRADAHAPIGAMGEHMHEKGEFMLSYRFMHMRMEGNRDGTNDLSPDDVLALGYMATPTDMDVDTHVFGAMYAPFDWVTLMLMLPYVEKSMDHVTATGVHFQTDSNGIGDLRFTGLLRLWQTEMHHLHLNAGFGFPTGSIDQEDDVPVPMMGFQKRRLPYPMQIGSGSYSLIPGLTYTGRTERWSWGAQAMGTIYLDENDNHYRVGNRFDGTAWVARNWFRWLSTSARLKGSVWANYAGADPALDPAAVPTADPNLRGGSEIDLAPGLNLVLPLGPLGEHRIAVEALLPVYRNLDGPQLKNKWMLTVGWQLAW